MARLYLPNVIAEAAVTEIALLHGFTRGSDGWALATKCEIASAIRRACLDVLGLEAWMRLPSTVSSAFHVDGIGPWVYVGPDEDWRSESSAPQVIGADSLPAHGGAAAHQKGSAESGAPHVSAEAQP